ncbi:MAG: acetyl-CoA carboxylase carboxyl transferase subunit beta [Deltaproteobacteria bacterium CG_4_9_14_3_um_filter_44_9]|nr:MAG: acetyl-CoA carboxylase carboxyl transferase subunit beta [Deltaproteobacteria bacterium CG_4_9_14_3_um_filter_44_9]
MWFKKENFKTPKQPAEDIKLPSGVWTKCPGCSQIMQNIELEKNLFVCPNCSYHFRLDAGKRLLCTVDSNSFKELFIDVQPTDFLSFKDTKPYSERIDSLKQKKGLSEAILTGYGTIKGFDVAIGFMDFSYMGGSMGCAVGEKLSRLAEYAVEKKIPLITFSCSGGARMQEGIMSLMQMAKTSAVISKFQESGGFYISVMTDPTTGGTTASFASLGDIILAEPGALIGFAGPRVIMQTIRQDLPLGFQRSEFLLEHGFLDEVIPRKNIPDRLAQYIRLFIKKRPLHAASAL